MLDPRVVVTVFCLYMACLFLVALWVERQSAKGRNPAQNPLIYSLSLAVYCTAWTYYGSVGKAATSGMMFLPIYLGPTLTVFVWWIMLRKLVRLKELHHITSIADFISARYAKSQPLAALVTVIAIFGITPYIALQFKAIISTFLLITTPVSSTAGDPVVQLWLRNHVGPLVVVLLIVFTIILGIRRLDPTERHQGMVAALAVECLVKLAAFLAVGIFVTYFVFHGFGDIFRQLAASSFRHLLAPEAKTTSAYFTWTSYTILSMAAILFLPRQFHVAVVENSAERHIRTAMWVFPVYMLLINVFVLPIALGGLLKGLPVGAADTFVLDLPFHLGKPWLSLLVFIGGFSAAAGMVTISSMTLTTMMTNHLLLPVLERLPQGRFLKRHLLNCRWVAAAGVIVLGYWFEERIGESYMLVNIGLISFAAVLQFAPSILGGLFWQKGSKAGAALGMGAGFLVWGYTLLLPSFVKSGWLAKSLLTQGPGGLKLLRPEQLFGMTGLDPLSHTLFWSMLLNVGCYVIGSLYFPGTREEQSHAREFVQLPAAVPQFRPTGHRESYIHLPEKLQDIQELLEQYFPPQEASARLDKSLQTVGIEVRQHISIMELIEFYNEVEKNLAGSIGSAAAHTALHRGTALSPREAKELSEVYGEILTDLKVTPTDLKRRIDYYQERETLLSQQAVELEGKVAELEDQIMERRRTQKALQESEERYRSLVENIDLGITLIDTDYQVVMTNSALGRLFQEAAEDFIGKKCYQKFRGQQSVCPYCPGASVLETGQPKDMVLEISRADGTQLPVRVQVFPIHRPDQTIAGFIEVLEDISKQRQTEVERARLAAAVDQAAESIVITGKDGRTLYVNPAFERISGYSREEVMERNPVFILKGGEQNQPTYDAIRTTLRRGEVWSGHLINKTKGGELYELESTISPIRDATGEVISYVSVGRDVTQMVRLEKQLRQAQKMEAIGTLAGGIAHDFNNILTIIIGYMEMVLEEPPPGEETRADLEEVLKAGYRARSLVEQILTFSRQSEQERKPLQITPIIKEALKLLRASLPTTIEIKQHLETRSDWVLLDPTQMHQVLMNLCTNAAHAMREQGGVLEIELTDVVLDADTAAQYPDLQPGTYLKLRVSDTGHGMNRAVLERIFDPFFTTKGAGEGTGLGLAVVYGIIKNHGGAINVYSEPGQGTTFHIYLPQADIEPFLESDTDGGGIPFGKERILFVDDETSILQMGQKMLERLGYEVIACVDPIEALELFRAEPHRFDLVITDQTMPRMTGAKLARELWAIRADIPIVLCTGYSQLINREQAQTQGFRELIHKPIIKRELAETIRRILDQPQQD